MPSIALDRAHYARAKAILAREFPSSQQLARFKWTKYLTGAAFGFAFGWVWAAASGSTSQRSFLIAATICYVFAVVMFLSNLPLLRRLWRVWMIARRLGYSQPRVMRSKTPLLGWVKTLMWLALLVPGLVITVVSAQGVVTEIGNGRWGWAAFALISVFFGLMCLLMYPMASVREKLHGFAALDATLETAAAGAGDTPIEIHSSVYDDLSEIERLQIEADRAEVLASRHNDDSGLTGLYINAGFFETLAGLDTDQADCVRRVLDDLSIGSGPAAPAGSGARAVEHVVVPGATLSIEIRRQGSGRRIEVLALRLGEPVEGARHA